MITFEFLFFVETLYYTVLDDMYLALSIAPCFIYMRQHIFNTKYIIIFFKITKNIYFFFFQKVRGFIVAQMCDQTYENLL